MSLLGANISFQDLYDLVRNSVDDPTSFDNSFRQYLFSNSHLLKFELPGPDVYIKALENAIPREFLDTNVFARNFLDKIIPGIKSRKSTKKVKKFVQPKVNPCATQKIPVVERMQVDKDCDKSVMVTINQTPLTILASGKPKLRTFGPQTRQLVRSDLLQKASTNMSNCKIIGCNVCKSIWQTAPITKCNHDIPCNKLGLSVHLSRSVIVKIHKVQPSEQKFPGKFWSNPSLEKNPSSLPSGVKRVKRELTGYCRSCGSVPCRC